jgi:hypothetical protein
MKKELLKALADFQQEVPVIHKGTQGYGYSYADLPSIFQIINPLMKKHGIGFTQVLNTKDGVTYLSTIIFHIESGDSIESTCEIPRIQIAKMNDYQAFGSGITYFRRYCLAASLCLVTDVDNDGAGDQIRKKEKEVKAEIQSKPKLNVNQFNQLVGAIMSQKQTAKGDIYTPELAIKLYDLSAEQLETIKSLEI